MRRVFCVLVACALIGSAYAELQNIEVGGNIRIRGRWWHNVLAGQREQRLQQNYAPKRPLGQGGVTSVFGFDREDPDLSFVEQRTVVNFKADFTDDVAAFLELESYDRWGDDFRSDYITGVDNRGVTDDDVEFFQAYVDMNDMFGYPLRARIGRQELSMGKGWLAGTMTSPTLHISFDGIRLTYDTEDVAVDAWWAKLAENSPAEQDSDTDYYGVYGTYKTPEMIDLSAYWLMVRDGVDINNTQLGIAGELLESLLDLDEYDPTYLHTVGVRAWGAYNAIDYDLELAYQFGEADAVGALFPAQSIWGSYADNDADFDAWAGDLELGYTLDMNWQPRIFVGGCYFEGEDNRDLSFFEWLNPFHRADASVSFNRLFSQIWYTSILDILDGAANFTNMYSGRLGVSAHPTESVTAGLQALYFGVVEPFDWPPYIRIGDAIAPLSGPLTFWTHEADDDIGVVSHVWLKYDYSEDLWVKVGWEHLFAGNAVNEGSFVKLNGTDLLSGTDDDDADYLYFDTSIAF